MAHEMRPQHIACICDPGKSHIMNLAAIGRELENRGHRFTVFQVPDLEPVICAEHIGFSALPARALRAPPDPDLALEQGDASVRNFLHYAIEKAALFCEEAPRALQSAAIDGVVVDMSEPGGATAAEIAGLPFVTVCNAVPLHSDPNVPPEFLDWRYSTALWATLRNRLAYRVRDFMIRPLHGVLNRYRREHALRPYHSPEDSFSPFAQITQLVPEFDFARRRLPEVFHYAGPYRRASDAQVPFPFEQLDGSPIVYASLGTVLGKRGDIWQAITEGCALLDVQLVISLGGQSGPLLLPNPPRNTIVVRYAPQYDLLARAALAITHAGLNSVMEALSAAVPLIAVPITGDQFGVAARIAYTQTGEVISAAKCSAQAISAAVRKILGTPAYRERGSAIRDSIARTHGAVAAAGIIEEVFATRRPVPRAGVAGS
jgi:zeaxanthin glucosyltransferase